jgi:signal transduction histidine kinase
MLEEVNRLNRLVDSLLVLSRADAGAVKLQNVTFPILDIARECVSLLQVLVDEKSQTLVLEGDPDALVECDRLFLRQALVNILHNAVRYSPAGSRISVRVWRESAHVVVEVADNGPGIPPEHAGKVFERFYRVDPSRSREGGGAGLGLSIAQWAVETHGGTILLHNLPGSGSAFQIRLPARTAVMSV